ncbi:hypothetical protein [Methylocaldum marinum]|jgi:hypothetical protein|nr:hypothetical protein [Methylocaldum marinum]
MNDVFSSSSASPLRVTFGNSAVSLFFFAFGFSPTLEERIVFLHFGNWG